MKEAVLCSVREFGLSCADLNYEVLICMRNYVIINNNLFIVEEGGHGVARLVEALR
jgi:hypothetical protein